MRPDPLEVALKARTNSVDQLVQDCADGKLPFSGPDSLCSKIAAIGYTTTSLYEMVSTYRARWVNCEACGGTGEIVKGPPGEPYNEHAELCQACEGTGRDCDDH